MRSFDGKDYLLERALTADLEILRADRAHRWGNLTYHAGQRNFGTVMAMAGRVTAVEVNEATSTPLDPEQGGYARHLRTARGRHPGPAPMKPLDRNQVNTPPASADGFSDKLCGSPLA